MDGEGELTSVSAFVHQFEPDKDWTAIAKKKVKNLLKYEGIKKTYQEILAEWDDKRDKGASAGTIVHSIKEAEALKRLEKVKVPNIHSGYKWSFPITEIENGYTYPELMIYDLEHMICGQSDEVEVMDGCINIYDYKTDKSIDFRGYSNEWKKADRLKAPVDHLDDCNGAIYSLKMSTYMYLLWKANKGRFKPGKIILKWCPIDRDENGYPILYDGIPKILKEEHIEIPYRKKEVIAMLETLKK